MKGSVVQGIVAQLNTIYWCKRYFETSRFKTVQHFTVSEVFKLLFLLYKKKKQFLKYIRRQRWPCETPAQRNNLLWFTMINQELHENQGNGNNVMQSFLKSCETHFSKHAGSLRQGGHRMREQEQGLAEDDKRDDTNMAPGHSPSNSQRQILEAKSCNGEFLSRATRSKKTSSIRDGKDVDE